MLLNHDNVYRKYFVVILIPASGFRDQEQFSFNVLARGMRPKDVQESALRSVSYSRLMKSSYGRDELADLA